MKMTFRWYGESDSITLDHIRQIPCMTGVVTAVIQCSRRRGMAAGGNQQNEISCK